MKPRWIRFTWEKCPYCDSKASIKTDTKTKGVYQLWNPIKCDSCNATGEFEQNGDKTADILWTK